LIRSLLLAIDFARRELRAGLSGFRVFLLSLLLGVSAIAGVESVSDAFLAGLTEKGRTLLGGDVSVRLVHRPATPTERTFLSRYGLVSEVVSMRAMAYARHGLQTGERTLVELKSVDARYPLYGQLALTPGKTAALACAADVCGAAAEQSLLDRLHIKVGDAVRIGTETLLIKAVLGSEPDRIAGGFDLGPHLLISSAALARTGLVQPGSLIDYDYRIAFSRSTQPEDFRRAALRAFPDAGFEIRDRHNAAPGIRRFILQAAMFLGLTGLGALVIGGMGAAGAIGAFLDSKRDTIATLKSLGADSRFVFVMLFLQVVAIATAAILGGLAFGALFPLLANEAFSNVVPPTSFRVYPEALAIAAAFGLLSVVAFTVPALARVREIKPADLFRELVSPARSRIRALPMTAAALAGLAIVTLSVLIAPSRLAAAIVIGGSSAVLVLLRATAAAVKAMARRGAHVKKSLLRLALANLCRPGAAAGSAISALGLGLTLLCAVLLLEAAVSNELTRSLPKTAPDFFFVDIQQNELNAFDRVIYRFKTASDYERTPMIRGRIVALKGTPAAEVRVSPAARWALAGDRGITYASTPPRDSRIVEGQWWPPDYRGPTRISFDRDLAKGMGLKLGDTITLNVLGRPIEGKIANFRDVDFRTGRQNFLLVLSPGIIDKAPHAYLATVRVSPREEESLYRTITDQFPGVSTIRVKEAISAAIELLSELSFGVRAASAVMLAAGFLVLAGAIASGARARRYDSTLLKVLGATRPWIAGVFAVEYGLIGLVAGIVALGAGIFADWVACTELLGVPFVFEASTALATVFGGAAVTLVAGLLGALAALSTRPASQLRTL